MKFEDLKEGMRFHESTYNYFFTVTEIDKKHRLVKIYERGSHNNIVTAFKWNVVFADTVELIVEIEGLDI